MSEAPPAPTPQPTKDSILVPATPFEAMAQQFQRELMARGCGHWRIFCTDVRSHELNLDDLVECPQEFGESNLKWEPWTTAPGIPRLIRIGGSFGMDCDHLHESGVLWLPASQVAIVRWFQYEYDWGTGILVAAPDLPTLQAFWDNLPGATRKRAADRWLVLTDYRVEVPGPRGLTWDDLVLPPPLRRELEAEIGSFFTDTVRQMYAKAQLPYRRRVLLYGPAGCGKTAIIRTFAALNPTIPVVMVLRSATRVVEHVHRHIRLWVRLAPALLIVEDIDHLSDYHVILEDFWQSGELLTAQSEKGLLMIATKRTWASRDQIRSDAFQRFDAVIRLQPPDGPERQEYLRRKMPGFDQGQLDEAAAMTGRLTFVELEQVASGAGIRAIHAGRQSPTIEDALAAIDAVRRRGGTGDTATAVDDGP